MPERACWPAPLVASLAVRAGFAGPSWSPPARRFDAVQGLWALDLLAISSLKMKPRMPKKRSATRPISASVHLSINPRVTS